MTCVVLTQPAPRSEAIAARLRQRDGCEVLLLSLTRITTCTDDAHLRALLDATDTHEMVLFVSPAAVDAVASLLARSPAAHWPATTVFAAIGPGTAAALAAHGVDPQARRLVTPQHAPYDAHTLIDGESFTAIAPDSVLVVKGEGGREDWITRLRDRGTRVDEAIVYTTRPNVPDAGTLGRLRSVAGDAGRAVFVVTQSATVARLGGLLDELGVASWAHAQPVLAIHPRIGAALTEAGWRRVTEIEPGDAALERGLAAATQG